ncbi:hypothetical protein [Belnapia moabensis]|uniref:hypothetical protein n=1 Tax=Belnapia moabensis TaxID=365533 RepID=UPI0012EE314C|nr:hypothetical protein [Belnapia moabensis]
MPATDGSAVMLPKLLDFQPAFEAALPPGWVLIGRCRAGEASGPAGDMAHGTTGGGCFVLAHAEAGVALVDLLPMRTPQAEAHLRRLLNAVDFSARCRGYLPVIQCEITPEELGGLHAQIEDAFAYDQVLTIADRGRWVGELRRILRASVTWEALDGPLPEPRPSRVWRPWVTPPLARLLRAGALGCGVLAVFGLGFVTALLMPQQPAASLPSGPAGFGVIAEATSRPPEPAPFPLATVEPPPAATPFPLTTVEPPPAATPFPLATAQPSPSASPAPEEPRPVALAEPTAQPDASTVAAAPRRLARLPLPIDRRCSEAVFRFQQGASLTAQEMAYVRQGCASMR